MPRSKRLFVRTVAVVALIALLVYERKLILPLSATVAALLLAPWLIITVARKLVSKRNQHDADLQETVKAILAALGIAVVLFWVIQGALTSRLQIEVSADSYGL